MPINIWNEFKKTFKVAKKEYISRFFISIIMSFLNVVIENVVVKPLLKRVKLSE